MLAVTHASVSPLSVPLREPFVIATGRVDATRAALVRVVVRDLDSGDEREGLGEAAALPPVTAEDQPDLLRELARFVEGAPRTSPHPRGLPFAASVLASSPPLGSVARAGAEQALLDAAARLERVTVRELLGGPLGRATCSLETDITLPIATPTRMGELAAHWWALGFRCFKVKVGRTLAHDLEALVAIADAAPRARLRLDANAGYRADEAIALLDEARRRALAVECFEQPVAAEDLDGMALLTRSTDVPVVADESVRTLADLERVIAHRAASGVNLKLAKSGGLLAAHAIGARARAEGLVIMCGGMVETRLGMTASAHVAAALGGVELVDLDTAMLLADDPFVGGYTDSGPTLTLPDGEGFALSLR